MTLPLIGCATGPAEQQQQTVVHACPVSRTYTETQEQQWAAEVSATPRGSMFRTVTKDYISLRDQVRDCWGKF